MGLFRGFMNRLLQIIVANLILGIGLFERLTYDRPVLGCNMCRGLKGWLLYVLLAKGVLREGNVHINIFVSFDSSSGNPVPNYWRIDAMQVQVDTKNYCDCA